MYAGHLGFALGASSFRRTIPLWLLLIASQLPDWLDVGYCMFNADRGMAGLHTHSIPVVAGAAVILALVYGAIARDVMGGLIVAFVVASHYGLDYLTGIKPTWAGGPVIGLQLYDCPIVDVLMESATITAGWLLYRRTLPLPAQRSQWIYQMLIGLLVLQVAAGVVLFLNAGGQVKC